MILKKVYLYTILLIVFTLPINLLAVEGMWLPQLLHILNEKEMKSMGMKLSAKDIYDINKGSLKDAIVHFGGFCTSEIISPNGLLLTNHHCGYSQIQNHSSVENNLLAKGFWAKNKSEELPNPGLSATFIDRIDDVTPLVLKGLNNAMTNAERQSIIDKNINEISKSYILPKYQKVDIRPFHDGNKYYAFVKTIYPDVRLVGTPPESIGKFGADTDNWMWPRHTGDFALFRIYAGKDNLPAEYAADNVPFTPKHFLPISIGGVSIDDFVMVFGFPGRTNQFLPSISIKQIIDVINPARIELRGTSLNIMEKYMRKSEATKIQYAAKFASLSNAYKKWQGELLGLVKSNAVAHKQDQEEKFLKLAASKPLYVEALNNLNSLYQKAEPYLVANEYYVEVVGRNVELTNLMLRLKRIVGVYHQNGKSEFTNQLERFSADLTEFYKDFDEKIDAEKFGALLGLFVNNQASQFVPEYLQRENLGMANDEPYDQMVLDLYTQSSFTEYKSALAILSMPADSAVYYIQRDPLYALVNEWSSHHTKTVATPLNALRAEINNYQTIYTKAFQEIFSTIKQYPDANGTLRVAYGVVEPYNPKDAVTYNHITYIDGILEKYIPGDYEFDLDHKMLDLIRNKDYGQYADWNGKMPICFIASNHTTGGNSGSPAIDAHGNLIGINFDRVWEGTMSDLYYDRTICRNIMVDARYILWVIDKYAGATHLIDEMKIVVPKNKQKARRKYIAKNRSMNT